MRETYIVIESICLPHPLILRLRSHFNLAVAFKRSDTHHGGVPNERALLLSHNRVHSQCSTDIHQLLPLSRLPIYDRIRVRSQLHGRGSPRKGHVLNTTYREARATTRQRSYRSEIVALSAVHRDALRYHCYIWRWARVPAGRHPRGQRQARARWTFLRAFQTSGM